MSLGHIESDCPIRLRRAWPSPVAPAELDFNPASRSGLHPDESDWLFLGGSVATGARFRFTSGRKSLHLDRSGMPEKRRLKLPADWGVAENSAGQSPADSVQAGGPLRAWLGGDALWPTRLDTRPAALH